MNIPMDLGKTQPINQHKRMAMGENVAPKPAPAPKAK